MPTWMIVAAASALAAVLLLFVGRVPLRYNVRNLLVRWRTTLMTALAFTLVLALLTVMLAFVNGMIRLTDQTGRPENVIILSEGTTDETFSNLGYSDEGLGDIENQRGIARQGGQALCSRETYTVVSQPLPDAPAGRPKRRFLQLRGVDDPEISRRVHGLELHPGGQWFSPAGVRQLEGQDASGPTAVEVVLGEGIARELGRDRSAERRSQARNAERLEVGDTFLIGDRPWLVVGVMKSAGSTFDSEVWGKRSYLGELFGKTAYTSLVLKADSAAEAARLKEFFNSDYKKAAVQALLEPEYYKSLSETSSQFLFGIVFVAIVMAIGGVFGIMNTMFAAVSQRTQDIGVLRLLGFTRRQILLSFLLESLLIALFGGLLGCALGYCVNGSTASSIVSAGPGGGKSIVLQMTVDPRTIAIGLLFALAMGLLGGLLPALLAMRTRPLDALR